MCKAIASNLGAVIYVEDDGVRLDNYRRIQIMMDITKPLCRFQNIKGKDGHIIKVSFAYERLQCLGHNEKDYCAGDDDD